MTPAHPGPRYRVDPVTSPPPALTHRGWVVVDREQRTHDWSPRIVVPLTTYDAAMREAARLNTRQTQGGSVPPTSDNPLAVQEN